MRPARLCDESEDEDSYWSGLEERPADFSKDNVTVRDGFRWRHFTNDDWPNDPEPRSLWTRAWDAIFKRST